MPRQPLRERARRGAVNDDSNYQTTRTAAIENMNAELRKKFKKIENQISDLRAENIRYYYNIGQTCKEIEDDTAKYKGKDHTPGMQLIETALATHKRMLRKCAQFVRTYTPEQIDYLIELKNAETGYQLHWGHISFLMTLDTARDRRSFATMTVNEMLEPEALHARIKKQQGREGGHGRKHEMPKTVDGQVRQVLKLTKQWVDKNHQVWNGATETVFGNVLSLEVENITDEMAQQFEDMEKLMDSMSIAARANITEIEKVRERIDNVLAERAKQEKLREESKRNTGREHRTIDLDD